MENEQLQNFNERLSEWIASQGFWFQIRYSLSGSGMKGRAMFHLLRLGVRLLVFLLVIAAGVLVYLLKRTDSEHFKTAMRESLKAGLSAKDLDMRGFDRLQGQLEITRLAAEGGNDTFFTSMEARNIHCNMTLFDGLAGIWKPGIISVSRLDADLRAGSDDPESAHKLAQTLFRKHEGIDINAFEVANANLRWGFSERTEGGIDGSLLNAQRTEHGWRLSFKGGTFHQNWLSGLEIVNLVVQCDPEGMVFETAELKQGAGTVNFSGLKVTGGERPTVKGLAKIRGLVLENVLPNAARSFVEGSISGDFNVFGSTNSSDGIGFEGQVVLDGKDTISLRERIHLLKALSVVDYSRTYHRVDFREGSFQMKTTRGGMELSDVNLKAEDLMTLEGKLNVRLPTQEEIQAAMVKGSGLESSPLFVGEGEAAANQEQSATESDFTLKRAAQEARRVKEGAQSPDSLSLFDRLGLSVELRRLQTQASERMSRMLRYEGMFRITVPGDAFERAPKLQEQYPKDPATGRIAMRVPIEGNLYELTLKQAEDVYQLGRR